jgi:hypothetical protein
MSTKTTFSDLTENPPKNTDKVAYLAEWSTNYDARKGTPFMLFLDLIGFSEEYFGTTQTTIHSEITGFLEAGLIGEALVQFSDHPQDVVNYCQQLVNAEQ